MADESENKPKFTIVNRIVNVPFVQWAARNTGYVYSSIKESNCYVKSTMNYTETGVKYVVNSTLPYIWPLAGKLERPINRIDDKLCKEFDRIERNVPLIKQAPKELIPAIRMIYEHSSWATGTCVIEAAVVCALELPSVTKVASCGYDYLNENRAQCFAKRDGGNQGKSNQD